MLIYDFEVFKQDWLVVIADLKNKLFFEIVNDKEALRKFYESHQYDIWAGFNNKNYDQYIIKAILTGHDPYKVSKYIVAEDGLGFNYSDDFKKVNVYSYDVYNTLTHGLKFYEGSMGDSIEESNVSFDIDRKLTDSEIKEVLKYCRHDVEETVKIFFLKLEDFEAQAGLIKLSRPQYLSKTQTQLAPIILKAEKRDSHTGEFLIDTPNTLKLLKYDFVREWYMDYKNHDYEKSLQADIAGVKHYFAWGGLHGAKEKYHYKGNILLMDVASLYPSLMINYDLLSDAVKDKNIYKELRDKRLIYKKEHNPMHVPMKLVLNKTYGAMKDKNNALYDPRQANRVCIYGQLLILDLIEKLEPYSKLIQLTKMAEYKLIELLQEVCMEKIKNSHMLTGNSTNNMDNPVESRNFLNRRNIWKEYPSNHNYLVSSDGRILSKKMNKELIPKKNWDGYLRIQIWKNNKCHMVGWHRVVAETFIDNPDKLSVVNHKDGNKQNNEALNLEWCTQKENIAHAFRTGLSKKCPKNFFATSKKVKQLDLNNNLLKVWPSISEINRELGICRYLITNACKNKKIVNNFKWEYCEISNDYRKSDKSQN